MCMCIHLYTFTHIYIFTYKLICIYVYTVIIALFDPVVIPGVTNSSSQSEEKDQFIVGIQGCLTKTKDWPGSVCLISPRSLIPSLPSGHELYSSLSLQTKFFHFHRHGENGCQLHVPTFHLHSSREHQTLFTLSE